jgi:hypothetical protein
MKRGVPGCLRPTHKKDRRETAFALRYRSGLQSGLHDLAAGRAILDQALASGGFLSAILGGGHSAASAYLGHDEYGWLEGCDTFNLRPSA